MFDPVSLDTFDPGTVFRILFQLGLEFGRGLRAAARPRATVGTLATRRSADADKPTDRECTLIGTVVLGVDGAYQPHPARHVSVRVGILGAVEYHEAFADLAAVLLEESWVLDIVPAEHGLALRLDAVLTPEHPLYESPPPSDQHCYRTAWLIIRSDAPVEVCLSGAPPAVDATGEPDHGHVDRFSFNAAEEHWEIEGEWGYARATDPEVALRFN